MLTERARSKTESWGIRQRYSQRERDIQTERARRAENKIAPTETGSVNGDTEKEGQVRKMSFWQLFCVPTTSTTKHWLKTKLFSGEAGAGGTRRVVDIGSDNSVKYSRPFFFLLRGHSCTNLHEILAPGLKLIFQTTLFDKNQFWPTVPVLTIPLL